MARIARQHCGIAHLTVAGLAVIAMPAQAELPIAIPNRDVLLEMIASESPVARGEAALALAQAGDLRDYPRIAGVARDSHPEASARGLAALGYLAAPGVESLLGDCLLERRPDDPLAHAAAFALGLLPNDHPAAAIDRFLERVDGGSYKRHRDALASLLVGMLRSRPADRRRALRELLVDESNKEPRLHRLAFRVLTEIRDSLRPREVAALLENSEPEWQAWIVRAMLDGVFELGAAELKAVERFALRPGPPELRAVALRVLVRERSPAALDATAKLLRSRQPDEIAAATHATLTLGGGALREALERHLIAMRHAGTKEAMFRAWRGAASKHLVDHCFETAVDADRKLSLRIAAIGIAANAGEGRTVPVLQRLIRLTDDPRDATTLCRHLLALDAAEDLPRRLYPTRTGGLRSFPVQLRAMFAAGHPDAFALLDRALADKRFDDDYKALLIRAWRVARDSTYRDGDLDAAPELLQQLLGMR